MFYIGIDIAKNTHWASIMSYDGEIIKEPFSFSNDNSGFQKFISNLESLDKRKYHFLFIQFELQDRTY